MRACQATAATLRQATQRRKKSGSRNIYTTQTLISINEHISIGFNAMKLLL